MLMVMVAPSVMMLTCSSCLQQLLHRWQWEVVPSQTPSVQRACWLTQQACRRAVAQEWPCLLCPGPSGCLARPSLAVRTSWSQQRVARRRLEPLHLAAVLLLQQRRRHGRLLCVRAPAPLLRRHLLFQSQASEQLQLGLAASRHLSLLARAVT